jgi:hypothetical protein
MVFETIGTEFKFNLQCEADDIPWEGLWAEGASICLDCLRVSIFSQFSVLGKGKMELASLFPRELKINFIVE